MTNKKEVLITGATGLVGSRLTEMLIERGYTVKHLVRNPKTGGSIPSYRWDVEKGTMDIAALDNTDAIVHLAGAGIAEHRWTPQYRLQIIDSRTQSTALLIKTLRHSSQHRVSTFVGASAVGFYGNRGDQLLTETDPPQENDFLSQTTQLWEQSYLPLSKELAIRTCVFRIGIVLSTKGGALPKTDLPIRLGAPGVYFGTGQQFYSWIHIDDLCHLFIAAIENRNMQGVYNAVAPQPVTNKEFTHAIAQALDKWAIALPLPEWTLRLGMGQMADVVLHSAKASSAKVEETGFSFQYPDLLGALKKLYGKP